LVRDEHASFEKSAGLVTNLDQTRCRDDVVVDESRQPADERRNRAAGADQRRGDPDRLFAGIEQQQPDLEDLSGTTLGQPGRFQIDHHHRAERHQPRLERIERQPQCRGISALDRKRQLNPSTRPDTTTDLLAIRPTRVSSQPPLPQLEAAPQSASRDPIISPHH